MSKITITDDNGNSQDVALPSNVTVTVAVSVPVSPPPPPPPPNPAPTPATATITGTLADGTAINLTLQPGQRLPLVAGKIVGSAIYHADGRSVCIENCYAGTTADLTGTFTVAAGTTQLFSGPLTIWCYSRTRPFWVTAPALNVSADLSLFPKLGAAPDATMAKQYAAADNSPMGMGCDIKSIGNGGEWPHLGPVPQWDACYLTNPSADNATVVRGMSDAGSPWPYHVIDPATNAMLDVTQVKGASLLPACFGPKNPIVKYATACPLNLEQAQGHATNRCALACALYGTAYDEEELAFWCNYVNSLWQNPGYRLAAGCCNTSHGELPRSIGRGLTVMLYAAKFSDHPAYFEAWVQAYAADLSARLLAQTGIHIDQLGLVYENNGFAPWQNHIMAYGVGLAIRFGYTAYQPVLDYLGVTLLDSMLAAQHEFATLYSVSAKDASGNIAPDWVTALKDDAAVTATVGAAIQCAEGSLALRTAMAEPSAMTPGDFDGYPASPTGYASMMQPALAMLADHATDQASAQAAWTKYTQHARQDYSQNPKYNVVP